MSAIFKTRKIPRHLIIQPDVPSVKRRRRLHIPRVLLLVLLMALALTLTWVVLKNT